MPPMPLLPMPWLSLPSRAAHRMLVRPQSQATCRLLRLWMASAPLLPMPSQAAHRMLVRPQSQAARGQTPSMRLSMVFPACMWGPTHWDSVVV